MSETITPNDVFTTYVKVLKEAEEKKRNDTQTRLEQNKSLLSSTLQKLNSLNDVWKNDSNYFQFSEQIKVNQSQAKWKDFDEIKVSPIPLPIVDQIPVYTTWISLTKNQRIAEEPSKMGKLRLYFDPEENETTIVTDSDEESSTENQKYKFSTVEDYVIWQIISTYGKSDNLFEEICNIFKTEIMKKKEKNNNITLPKKEEVEERYFYLKRRKNIERISIADNENHKKQTFFILSTSHNDKNGKNQILDAESDKNGNNYDKEDKLPESLNAAMDSFDNLFCRRCLVFDCKLHGSNPAPECCELQSPSEDDDYELPCGLDCHFIHAAETMKDIFEIITLSSDSDIEENIHKNKYIFDINENSNIEYIENELPTLKNSKKNIKRMKNKEKKHNHDDNDSDDVVDDDVNDDVNDDDNGDEVAIIDSYSKDLKNKNEKNNIINLKNTNESIGDNKEYDKIMDKNDHDLKNTNKKKKNVENLNKNEMKSMDDSMIEDVNNSSSNSKVKVNDDSKSQTDTWSNYEVDMFEMGLKIFGENSCKIARTLLFELKTCSQINERMKQRGKSDNQPSEEKKTRKRRRKHMKKKGRFRLPTPSSRFMPHKDEKGREEFRYYMPCACKGSCNAATCDCMQHGTLCEKFCGCWKDCENRASGCQCQRSLCKTNACPCTASHRECDPDICKNCFLNCGKFSKDFETHSCQNMKLFLNQHKPVLLGRSDVAGWGAFSKGFIEKNEYIGEYFGEMISHVQADKRGKIYDRVNCSFLFDLDDQNVIDAFRKGNKLKFANHSHDPNCYCKVVKSTGDNRVGIFAKKNILPGQELFYDYQYSQVNAPSWSKKVYTGKSQIESTGQVHSRHKKNA